MCFILWVFHYNKVQMAPELSIIIPVFNEKDSIGPLVSELQEVLPSLNCEYEILLVDDGSRDGTSELLEQVALQHPEFKYIGFKRNFGQTAAMLAGIDYAKGEYIIAMDSDLQNDPHDIPALLRKAEEGYDIVSGWRKNRKDKFLRSFCSRIANRLLSRFLHVPLHDYGCTLKVYRLDVLEGVRLYGEMHRFLPAIANWAGARVTEVVVNHRARQFGRSKYNLKRIRAVFLDLIAMKFFTNYIQRPIRVFGRLSLWVMTLATLSGFKAVFDKIVFQQDITNTPYLIISIFLYIVSLQLMAFGLLCEVQIRTYFESQGKKTYRVSKQVNIDNAEPVSK